MGRISSSCFRIITCGSDSADADNKHDLGVSEIKSPKDKHVWSFRKKSTSHRVLSSSVTSERSPRGKNVPESSFSSSQFSCSSAEKVCSAQCTEDKTSVDSKAFETDTTKDNGREVVFKADERVILIQAAIRGFLVRRELLKLKEVVDLQAEKSEKLELVLQRVEKEKFEKIETPLDISSEVGCKMAESDSKEELLESSESEENLITYEGDKINFHACQKTNSLVKDESEQPVSKIVIKSSSPKNSGLENVPEHLESEREKLTYGSRKASTPDFLAAQTKFEELSSNVSSSISLSSTHHIVAETKSDGISSEADTAKMGKMLDTLENAGSECGIELSISSTLDSPDGSEAGAAAEHEHKVEILEEATQNCDDIQEPVIDAEENSSNIVTHLTCSIENQLEKLDHVKDESDGSVVSIDASQIEQKLETSKSDVKTETEIELGCFQEHESSPEASPRSHITVSESQPTPSSQVSVKRTKDKTKKSGSNQKVKSLSAGKKSTSNLYKEQLPKDMRNEKRQNSFGSDQEPRDSIGSNSLPHFMQATESARSKIHANNGSPRSSSDVQDEDIYVKKRHSLPGANGKKGSPRIQQGAKERKWQR